MTSRLVASASPTHGSTQWPAVLRGCGGHDAFLRTYRGLYTEREAAEFGLLPGDASRGRGFAEVVTGTWLPLAKGLNQINRSMGRADLYPFVLAEPVLAKLAYVADLVQRAGNRQPVAG